MISFGSLYVQTVKYPHRDLFPVAEKGWTHEIEEPYRKGSCLVFRAPFTKLGLVFGVWTVAEQDEEVALTSAIWGRKLDVSVDELLEWD